MLAHFYQHPIHFERNDGQVDAQVKYLTRGPGYTFYFTPQEIITVFSGESGESEEHTKTSVALKLKFLGSNPEAILSGTQKLESISNYFIGNDSSQWRTHIPNYAKVTYRNLYEGIDAAFYGNPQQLEYDLLVGPGADPQNIRLQIEGAKELALDSSGNLEILTDAIQKVVMQKPLVYQFFDEEGKERRTIKGDYILAANQEVRFRVAGYDATKMLVIDPIIYSTFLGSFSVGNGITVDDDGNAYVIGGISSGALPTTVGAVQTVPGGSEDAFVTKLNSTGTSLIYSTYLGGSNSDLGNGIAIDSSGNAYVTGFTNSTNFPTKTAFQDTLKSISGGNAFVTKLNPTGTALVYSTYLGGSGVSGDAGNGVAVDDDGYAYVTGYTYSSNFPTTSGVVQSMFIATNSMGFVTKFNPSGMTLDYSTYLGGSNDNIGNGIAADTSGNAYVTGFTNSTNFPTTVGVFQSTIHGISGNIFVTQLNSTGTAFVYSTYLGGSAIDVGNAIAVDGGGNAYVTGYTESPNFPTTSGAYQSAAGGNLDVFVTKLNSSGMTLDYSTYLGGSGSDEGYGIAIDSGGNAYVTGYTESSNFPTTSGAYQTAFLGSGGSSNAFMTKLNSSGTALDYSTYLGGTGAPPGDQGNGIAVDSNGNVYVAGFAYSPDFPTTQGAYQTTFTAAPTAFIAKFELGLPVITAIAPTFGPASGGTSVIITGTNFIGATAVDFGLSAATSFIVNSATQITAISPAGVGIVDVTVTTPNGTSVTSAADQFTYFPLPVVTNVAPSFGPSTGGTSVIITGTNFIEATALDFGVNAATSFTVNSATQITATSPAGTGVVDVTVTTLGGTSVTSPADLFTYLNLTPINLRGHQVKNRFATQTDYVNVLQWREEPAGAHLIVSYRIYRNAQLTQLIATISSSAPLQYEDHNRVPGKTYTYFVVSVDVLGDLSAFATVTVPGR